MLITVVARYEASAALNSLTPESRIRILLRCTSPFFCVVIVRIGRDLTDGPILELFTSFDRSVSKQCFKIIN
jgi:hypothetical protein